MARPNLLGHRKFRRLVAALGLPVPHVLGHLELVWFAAYEDGEPEIGDAVDVELAAQWGGDPGAFAAAMVSCGGKSGDGFLEEEDGIYRVHDLYDHAPEYVRKRRMRELARQAGVSTGVAYKAVTAALEETGESLADLDPSQISTPSPNGRQRKATSPNHGTPKSKRQKASLKPESPPIPKALTDAIPEFEELWKKRIKAAKSKPTPTAEATQLEEAADWLAEHGPAYVLQAVKEVTMGGWQGFFPPKSPPPTSRGVLDFANAGRRLDRED